MKKNYFLVLCILSLSILPLISNARSYQPVYKYYNVVGHDFKSLNASMKSKRPSGFNSMNESHISWQFIFNHINGQCFLKKPVVNIKVFITLPKWLNFKSAPKKLKTKWLRYTQALKKHQLGHVNYAYKSQQAILIAFKNLKPEADCKKLKIKANQLARLILVDFDRQDKKYEIRTKKGLEQGAILRESSN